MDEQRASTLWPYIGLFTCLLLSLLLPQYWGTSAQTVDQRQDRARSLRERRPCEESGIVEWGSDRPIGARILKRELADQIQHRDEVDPHDFLHHLASLFPEEMRRPSEEIPVGLEFTSLQHVSKPPVIEWSEQRTDPPSLAGPPILVADASEIVTPPAERDQIEQPSFPELEFPANSLQNNDLPYGPDLQPVETSIPDEPVIIPETADTETETADTETETADTETETADTETIDEAEPKGAEPVRPSLGCWRRPIQLEASLRRLSNFSTSGEWSERVLREIDQLLSITTYQDSGLESHFDRLEELVRDGRKAATPLPDGEHRETFIRCVYGLEKRLDLWRAVRHVALSVSNPKSDAVQTDWQTKVEAVHKLLGATDAGHGWAKFLLLDELSAADEENGIELAELVLDRISEQRMTPVQFGLLRRRPVQELTDVLCRASCLSVGFPKLLDRIEQFETSGRATDAERVAGWIQLLLNSADPALYRLGNQLDRHWRNANVRVSISSELMGRYLPDANTVSGRVQNRLGDAVISGTSWTTTELNWHLVPDDERIRVELVARGSVRSQTTAEQGVARTQNQGRAQFDARKSVWFGRNGLHIDDAVATAKSSVQIQSLRTNYDGIPLIGSLARSMAQSRAEEQRHRARQMMERRVVQSAKQRLNAAVDGQLSELGKQFETNVLDPLARLGLEPTPINLKTTKQRVIARYRLADRQQLAAWSPRPIAFTDTLISLQIHQSVINNLVDQLNLHGKRFDLEDIYQTIPRQLGFELAAIPDDLPENVKVRFAAYEPIRFRFDNGRARIIIRLASLSKGRRYRWRNLTVMGDYAPSSVFVNAQLIREDSIQLTGYRLSMSDQVVLRGIFSNVLSRKRPLTVLRTKLANDQRVKDLGIQEFVVEDGWIGVAWGVHRLASRDKRSVDR